MIQLIYDEDRSRWLAAGRRSLLAFSHAFFHYAQPPTYITVTHIMKNNNNSISILFFMIIDAVLRLFLVRPSGSVGLRKLKGRKTRNCTYCRPIRSPTPEQN